MKVRGALFLLALLCVPAMTRAQASAKADVPAVSFLTENETLKGISVMAVQVDDMPLLEGRLSSSTLRSAIELRLRQTGITVKDSKDPKSALYPTLHIATNMLGDKAGLFSYHFAARLLRVVEIPSSEETTFYAIGTTWQVENIAIVGRNKVVESVRGDIDDCVTRFLNAYLEQNPKK